MSYKSFTKAPLFYMNDPTGKLKFIVKKFHNQAKLNQKELDFLKWYIIQWIDAIPLKPPDYQNKIRKMSQEELDKYCSEELLDYSIDPF